MEKTISAHVQFMDATQKNVKVEAFTLIGNDPTCHILVTRPNVGERHARIEKKDEGYLIRDLRKPLT